MHYLVIDMTHGGVKIAISLAKKGKVVHGYDIYNTLNDIDRRMLEIYDVDLCELDNLANLRGDITVISPIHCPLESEDIMKNNPELNYTFMTHHKAVGEILSDWGDDIPKIEITGVKGKTSSVFMLKEILIDENPLILSSLGALLYENENEIVLKRNISITPANIKETIDLAYKVANPVCKIAEGVVESENLRKYSSAIFENSLGGCGIGDVGLLTNIAEDYPIARGKSSASKAKSQIFDCSCVVIEKESLDEYYADIGHDNVNSFSVDDSDANLYAENIDYTLDETAIDIIYSNVMTVTGILVNGKISLKTFAPGRHHVSNVLGVVLTCICLEIPHDKIVSGIANYGGIPGRTNKRTIDKSIVIEEINPGINTEAIKQSINMIGDLNDYYVCVGGDYGITCEEIDEAKVGEFLDTLDCDLILTGEVGQGICEKMIKKPTYISDYHECYDLAVSEKRNLLFIYRSSYDKLSQR